MLHRDLALSKEDDLEAYPLARVYKWRSPKRDTGGILFLLPPASGRRGGRNDARHRVQCRRARVDAINPDDLHPIAKEAAMKMQESQMRRP